jgi:uncharacterized protein
VEKTAKNIPEPTKETAPYWEGTRNRELRIQHCRSCGHRQFYPRLMCTDCMSRDLEWTAATGRGTVRTYTVIHRAISKAYAAQGPYVVAIVGLEEGPTMMTNIIGCDPEDVRSGMPVKVIFEEWTDDITVPMFEPI